MKKFNVIVFSLLLAVVSNANAAPIHDAAAKGNLAKLTALISETPSLLTATDKDGATPLHYAAAGGNVQIIRFLLNQKADVMAIKKDGVTPLHVAVALGHKEAVEALLAAKADPNAKDKKGRTPISLAEAGKSVEIRQILARGNSGQPAPPKLPIKPSKPAMDNGANTKRDITVLANEFVGLITKKQYSNAHKMLDATMKRLMPPQKLASNWQLLKTELGPFISMGSARSEKMKGVDLVHISCQFEKATYDAQIAFDSAGLVSGFYVLDPTKANSPAQVSP